MQYRGGHPTFSHAPGGSLSLHYKDESLPKLHLRNAFPKQAGALSAEALENKEKKLYKLEESEVAGKEVKEAAKIKTDKAMLKTIIDIGNTIGPRGVKKMLESAKLERKLGKDEEKEGKLEERAGNLEERKGKVEVREGKDEIKQGEQEVEEGEFAKGEAEEKKGLKKERKGDVEEEQGKGELKIGKKEVAKGEVAEGKEEIKEGTQKVKEGELKGNGDLVAKGEVEEEKGEDELNAGEAVFKTLRWSASPQGPGPGFSGNFT